MAAGWSEKGEGGRRGRTEIQDLGLFGGEFLFPTWREVGKTPPSSWQRGLFGEKHPHDGVFLRECGVWSGFPA